MGGALRIGRVERRRSRHRSPTGSSLSCPTPPSRVVRHCAGVISLPRSPAAILHAGALGEPARLPLPGRRRGAGGELGEGAALPVGPSGLPGAAAPPPPPQPPPGGDPSAGE